MKQISKVKTLPNLSLRREREKRNWTQEQLAERAGTTAINVSRWERGITSPGLHFRNKLCAIFEKSAAELGFIRTEVMRPRKHTAQTSSRQVLESSLPVAEQPLLFDPAIPPPLKGTHSLIGRKELMDLLKQRLCEGKSLALSALNGLPGVGKTAIATELVHDPAMREYFRDGILWAGLGREPNIPGLLGRWGTLLGIAPAAMQSTQTESWVNAIRAAIGGRRMLLVVDDAWQIKDALAFKVGGPNCAHLLTTRFPEIAFYFAGDCAIVVHELNDVDSIVLLEQLVPGVATSELSTLEKLVRSVGGLPLALTLMGKYLRTEAYGGQQRRLQTALNRLQRVDERLRLEQPQAPVEVSPSLPSDTPLSLLTVINISDQQLDRQTGYALRALAVFPPKPNTFSEEAAIAVANQPVECLDKLIDAGLLESSGTNRYTLHQTIADYARFHLVDAAPEERLVLFFSSYLETHKDDYSALDDEVSNIFAALQKAFERGMRAALVQGATAFAPFLETRGLYTDAETHLNRAHQAALTLGDEAGLACIQLHRGRVAERRGNLLRAEELYQDGLKIARKIEHTELMCTLLENWGETALNRGDFARADQFVREGLALARELGNRQKMAILLKSLGEIFDCQGEFARGEETYHEALRLAREVGDRETMSVLLQNLGAKAVKASDYALGERYLLEGLEHARQIGHRQRMSALLLNLGAIAFRRKQYQRAAELYQESFELARVIGHRVRLGNILQNLGELEGERGNYQLAEQFLQESLDIAHEIGHRWLISETLSCWGELYLRQQKIDEAFTTFNEAFERASETGAQELIAIALFGLARIAAMQGNSIEAKRKSLEALKIFGDEVHEKADEIRAWLAALA